MRYLSVVLLLAVLPASGLLYAGEIDGDLAAKLDQADAEEVISALVYLNDRVDLPAVTQQMDLQEARLSTRHETVVRALQQKAQATQPQFVDHLNRLRDEGGVVDFETFWVANIIRVDATPDEIMALADRDDVERIYFNYPIELIKPVAESPAAGLRTPFGLTAEPGVEADAIAGHRYDGRHELEKMTSAGAQGAQSAARADGRGAGSAR